MNKRPLLSLLVIAGLALTCGSSTRAATGYDTCTAADLDLICTSGKVLQSIESNGNKICQVPQTDPGNDGDPTTDLNYLITNGTCSTSQRYTCTSGIVNATAHDDTSTRYQWRCDGLYGGTNSGTCWVSK